MLKWVKGNLLDDDADLLVNPVNTVGVMGGGLARDFALKYPEMLEPYQRACHAPMLRVGSSEDHCCIGNVWRFDRVLCLPTKRHWRDPSTLEYVALGVKSMDKYCQEHGIKTVAVPQLGCGLGGLLWVNVRPILIQELQDSPVEYRVYGDAP